MNNNENVKQRVCNIDMCLKFNEKETNSNQGYEEKEDHFLFLRERKTSKAHSTL